MSNRITIELCAEDRARLDRLAEALEKSVNNCEAVQQDPIQQAIAATLAKVNNPTEEPTEAPTTEAAQIDILAAEAKPTITQDQLQQKVMQLAAANNGALKAKVREIVNTYAQKVSDVPEDKRTEVWDKLTALEKEVQA